jgi:hypothetical protein
LANQTLQFGDARIARILLILLRDKEIGSVIHEVVALFGQ